MSTQTQILETGTLLLDRYRIQTLQTQDSISEFFLALDTRFDDMKVLVRAIKHPLSEETVTHLFPSAAQIGAILGHQSPHVVQVMNYGSYNDKIPFYILESSKSKTLKALSTNMPMSTGRFLDLMQQTCLGLASAHSGFLKDGKSLSVVHGDLKPTNILVFADSGLGEIAKIMGFGLKDVLAGHDRTRFMGTPAYSAPEHFEGKTSTNSDIYSLGVILFLGLTGQLPIKPTGPTLKHWHHAHRQTVPLTIQEVAPKLLLPQSLQVLVMRCLAKNPQERPQGAIEVSEILKDCLLELAPNSDPKLLDQQSSQTNPKSAVSQQTGHQAKQMAGSFA
jgi:eukaryotic-like serine/threonine-protein kinase